MKIKNINPKEIKDSRGNPTVEVEIETGKGKFLGACPSGASKGKHEAIELRDEDGKGVKKAISNIKKIIAPEFKGKEFNGQKEIDEVLIKLDGTENKSRLGVNAILPVSIAFCRAFAAENKIPLYKYIRQIFNPQLFTYNFPKPCFNIIEGGAHAENDLDIQEFMVIPQKQSFRENFVIASQIYQNLKEILEKSGEPGQGDEGGFAPKISKTEKALFSLKGAIEKFPETRIGLDAAATQFFKDGKYFFEGNELTRTELFDFYKDLVNEFPMITFIEDPFSEEDWTGFSEINRQLSGKINILGDDLLTTNVKRMKEAQDKKACSGTILKLNQIGTVTETLAAANLARSFGWKLLVSHRSGETHDDFIADLAVGIGADYIKAGAPTTPERMVKYNRVMEIESELSKNK